MSLVKRGYGFGGYGYGHSKPLVNYHASQNGDSVTTVVKEMSRVTVSEKPGYGAAQKHGAFLEEVCDEGRGAGVYSHGGAAVQKHGYEQKAAYGQQHGSEVVGSGYEYDNTQLQQHDSRAAEQKHGFVEGHKTSSYQHHGSSDNVVGGYVDDAAVQHAAAKNYTVKKHHGYEQKEYGQQQYHGAGGGYQQQQHGGVGFGGYDAAGYDDVDAGLLHHGGTGVQKQHGYGYGGSQKATQKQHGGYSSSSGHKGYGYVDGQEAYYQPQGCDDGVAGYDALVKSRATQRHGGAYGHKAYKHGAEAAGGYVDLHHGGNMTSVMIGGVPQSYGKEYKHHDASPGPPDTPVQAGVLRERGRDRLQRGRAAGTCRTRRSRWSVWLPGV